MAVANSWLEHPIFQAIAEHPIVKEYHKTVTQPLVQASHHFKVYHPSDVYWIDGHIQVKMDMAGFDENKIISKLRGNILTISAERESVEDMMSKANKKIDLIVAHRPLKFYAVLHIPFVVKDGEEPKIEDKSCMIINGVYTLNIVNVKQEHTFNPKQSQ